MHRRAKEPEGEQAEGPEAKAQHQRQKARVDPRGSARALRRDDVERAVAGRADELARARLIGMRPGVPVTANPRHDELQQIDASTDDQRREIERSQQGHRQSVPRVGAAGDERIDRGPGVPGVEANGGRQ